VFRDLTLRGRTSMNIPVFLNKLSKSSLFGCEIGDFHTYDYIRILYVCQVSLLED
jgi:hypothetical protein